MVHKNYFVFKANSNYDLGYLMGQEFSEEAVGAISSAKIDNWNSKSTISKKELELTQKYFPQYVEEVKGYADGAKVNFFDLWTIGIESDAEIDNDKKAKCTNIITNNCKLIGHNEDAMESGLENTICIIKKTLNDLTTFEIYYYNTLGGNSVGVSSFGYVHALNTLLFTDVKLGIPKNVIARYLLETNNPNETIKKVLNLPRASGYNHNIVNKDGKIWNLELTTDNGIITNPNLPFAHTNHCLNIKSSFCDDYGTISRLEFARTSTKNIMTVEELIQLQGDTSMGSNNSVFNERTIGKMIVDFETMVAQIWLLRESELGWISYPLDFLI